MTTKTLSKALMKSKPAIIKERGVPRYVVIDWATYDAWREQQEDLEDAARFLSALADTKNQKSISLADLKKKHNLT